MKFNEAGNQILASRFLIQAINISGTNHEKEMVKALREVVAQSPLNASVFHPYFVFFDQVIYSRNLEFLPSFIIHSSLLM